MSKTKVAQANAKPVPGLTLAQEEKLVRDCYENFPEAGLCLRCTSWKYDAFSFEFIDDEGKKHLVLLGDAVRGLRIFAGLVAAGRLPGLGLPADYLTDTGTWDAFAFDALAQCAIFGEVIYG